MESSTFSQKYNIYMGSGISSKGAVLRKIAMTAKIREEYRNDSGRWHAGDREKLHHFIQPWRYRRCHR